MKTKHTPGPWETGTQTKGSTTLVSRIETGFAVAEMRNVHFREEAEANARLIAAAPELLEALQTFLTEYVQLVESGDAGFWNADEEEKVIAARAAIAKATGKTP